MKYSEETNRRIVELYNNNLSYRNIAVEIGCSPSYVKKIIHKNGIEPRNKLFYARKFDDATEQKVICDYMSGLSIREIACKYECSTAPIVSLFKRSGVEFRDISHARREYCINENYFDDIDTPNKAYILGFLYADGSNTSVYEHGHYMVRLRIQTRDEHILKSMLAEIGSNDTIRYIYSKDQNKYYAELQIRNKHMVLRLHELGIAPRKTFNVVYPDFLPSHLHRHFIRGLVDGDGSIASNLQYLNLVGTRSLCERVSEIVHTYTGASSRMYDKKISPGIVSLFYSKHADMLSALDWLYNSSEMKLDRKYKLYLQAREKYTMLSVS